MLASPGRTVSQLVVSHVRVIGLFLCEAHLFLMAQEMVYKPREERISREQQERLRGRSAFRLLKEKCRLQKEWKK